MNHIDPREDKKREVTPDMHQQIALWRERGETPFVLVRRAYRHLVEGNYIVAGKWLDEAWRYVGVFYKTGTKEDERFEQMLISQRYNFLLLRVEFEKLRPEA